MLPENFGDLESLTEFLAEGTSITEVPFSITRIKKLKILSLSVCKEDKPISIPSLMCSWVLSRVASKTRNVKLYPLFQLSSLRTLRLANCNLSDEANLMNGVGNLQFLENLDLRGNHFSSLPDTIGRLPKLEKLLLDNCTNLESLPSMPSSLLVFSAVNCISLKKHFLDQSRLLTSNLRRRPRSLAFDPQFQPARAVIHMEWCKNLRSCENLARNKLESFLLKVQYLFILKLIVHCLCKFQDFLVFFP